MLEKIKQARASDCPIPGGLLEIEKEISTRYSPEELKKLKQYGFTGMNVEHRARCSGLSDEYNIIYRNFSRYVHSTDFAELLLQQEYSGRILLDRTAHLENRDDVCCSIAFMSVASISAGVNYLAGLGLNRRFRALLMARDGRIGATSPKVVRRKDTDRT